MAEETTRRSCRWQGVAIGCSWTLDRLDALPDRGDRSGRARSDVFVYGVQKSTLR